MIGGVVADAWHRRRLMLMTQSAATCVALTLTSSPARDLITLPLLYALTALGSTVSSFDLPARQALVPTLVPREDLANALSLNTAMMQSASIAGPAIGGILIATLGLTWVYLLNAVSFGFVIAALLHDARRPRGRHANRARSGLLARRGRRAALRLHVAADPLDDAAGFFRDVLLVGVALLPIFAQDIWPSVRQGTAGSMPLRRPARC
jgi:MFS family permease